MSPRESPLIFDCVPAAFADPCSTFCTVGKFAFRHEGGLSL